MPRVTFKHSKYFPEDLALIINGKRNAGKTTLFFNLLMSNHIDYNNLWIYTKTKDQFLYQFISHGFKNKLKKETIISLLQIYENDMELEEEDIAKLCEETARDYPEKLVSDHEKIKITISDNINDFQLKKLSKAEKNLMVFDDCSEDNNQSIQKDFFQTGRHHKCSCIYITHRFHAPEIKPIRAFATCFIFFEHARKVSEQIVRDINIGMDKKEFYQLTDEAWRHTKEKKYIYINPELEGDRVLISPFFT